MTNPPQSRAEKAKMRSVILARLARLEHQSDSILNVADDDPELHAIRDSLNQLTGHIPQTETGSLRDRIDQIDEMLRRGFGVYEIARELGVSEKWVRKTAKIREITIQKPYRYHLTNDVGVHFFSPDQESILRFLGVKTYTPEHLKEAMQPYFHLIVGQWHFEDIPVGSLYSEGIDKASHRFTIRLKNSNFQAKIS